jgi:hypothetical protein
MLTPQNWTLRTYTNSVYTALVTGAAVVSSLSVSNSSGVATDIQIRLRDGAGELAIILPFATIDAGEAVVLDLRSMVVKSGQTLEVYADGSGINWAASGAI